MPITRSNPAGGGPTRRSRIVFPSRPHHAGYVASGSLDPMSGELPPCVSGGGFSQDPVDPESAKAASEGTLIWLPSREILVMTAANLPPAPQALRVEFHVIGP